MAQGFIKKAVTSTFSQLESKKNAIKEYCREKHIFLKVEQRELTGEFLLEFFGTKKAHSIIGFNHSGHIVFQGASVSKRLFQEADIDQLLIVTEERESKPHFVQLLQVKLPKLSAGLSEGRTQSSYKGNKGFLSLSSGKEASTPVKNPHDPVAELEELYDACIQGDPSFDGADPSEKNNLFVS